MLTEGVGIMNVFGFTGRRQAAAVTALLLLLATVAPAAAARASARPGGAPSARSAAVARFGTPVDSVVADFTDDRQLDVVELFENSGLSIRRGVSEGVYGDAVAIDAAGIEASRLMAV